MAISATVGWPEGSTKPSLELSVPAGDAIELLQEISSILTQMPAPKLEALLNLVTPLLPKP